MGGNTWRQNGSKNGSKNGRQNGRQYLETKWEAILGDKIGVKMGGNTWRQKLETKTGDKN